MQDVGVDPPQLVRIEHRATLADALERERLEQLSARQDLALVARVKSEQGEIADQRIGYEARAAPVSDRDRGLARALAHLAAVAIQDERHVREPGRRFAERLVEH